MHEIAVDIAQVVLVALQAAWLALGAYENIRRPEVNRVDVAKVLGLDAVAGIPELYREIEHRRITDPAAIARVFAAVVAAECLVALALSAGALLLLASLFGLVGAGLASGIAILAVTGFTAIWAGFLIGGQWFYYWYGEYGQRTHFFMTLWGIATLLVLAL
jgi:predicted small integral membrane protein